MADDNNDRDRKDERYEIARSNTQKQKAREKQQTARDSERQLETARDSERQRETARNSEKQRETERVWWYVLLWYGL